MGPKMANFPGAVSANAKNLFFFRIPGSSPVYQFSIETGNWSPANAAFTVPNIEGLGPVTDPNTDLIYIAAGQIFILDIPSSTWTTGPAGAIPRAYMACTFAGDQFIAWGGVQTTSLITDGEVVIFDVPTSTWVKKYTPPASYQSLVVAAIPGAVGARPGSIPTASGGMPPAPSGSNGTIGGDKSSDSGSGSGVGGIVGGVVGGLVVICAIVVFLFYKRRKAQGQSQGNLYVKANTTPDGPSTTVAVSGYPPGHDHGHDRGNSRGTYDEPRPFIAASPDKSTAAVFSPVQNERNPHLFIPTLPDASEASAPVFSNQTYQSPQTIQDQVIGSSAYYQQMHEIENQRRQLELKRQLLILEEQGQQLRQAPQQQYQQQQMTQYPMPESVSAAASGYPIPTTAATVQLLPDATEPSTMAMGQYYMTAHSDNRESKSTFEPYHATPVIYLATGTSTSGGRSPQSTPTSG
ncbi:hypothetical protein EC991_006922 [Linnemannia zychae]|nr:hypothetical protein EC991_006922 [Linnemannia zychae]